jgi:hypothetical protein
LRLFDARGGGKIYSETDKINSLLDGKHINMQL